jgi:hypothetical protein
LAAAKFMRPGAGVAQFPPSLQALSSPLSQTQILVSVGGPARELALAIERAGDVREIVGLARRASRGRNPVAWSSLGQPGLGRAQSGIPSQTAAAQPGIETEGRQHQAGRRTE